MVVVDKIGVCMNQHDDMNCGKSVARFFFNSFAASSSRHFRKQAEIDSKRVGIEMTRLSVAG